MQRPSPQRHSHDSPYIFFFVTGWSEEDRMGSVEQYLSLLYTSFEFFTRCRRRNFKLCHGTELEREGRGGEFERYEKIAWDTRGLDVGANPVEIKRRLTIGEKITLQPRRAFSLRSELYLTSLNFCYRGQIYPCAYLKNHNAMKTYRCVNV
jgi:hypothetical protein